MQEFDGSEDVFISKVLLKQLKFNFGYQNDVRVEASVTDRNTGISMSETGGFKTVSENVKVDALYTPDTVKPGLSYTAYVSFFVFLEFNFLIFTTYASRF